MKYWLKDNAVLPENPSEVDLTLYDIAPEGKTWFYPTKELVDEPTTLAKVLKDHYSKLDDFMKTAIMFLRPLELEAIMEDEGYEPNKKIYIRWIYNWTLRG